MKPSHTNWSAVPNRSRLLIFRARNASLLFATVLGGGILFFPSGELRAAPPKLERVVASGETELFLEFSDEGSSRAEDFEVEYSIDLKTWHSQSGAAVEDLGEGSWRAVVPFDAQKRRCFFRVTRNGLPITGAFASPTTTLKEGESGGVEVQFSGPYTGVVDYTVNFGDGNPQRGSVQVRGKQRVIIPVSLSDDAEGETLRGFSITLDGGDFSLGPLLTTNVTVEDNDSRWAGVLIGDDGVTSQVELKVAKVGGTQSASLLPQSGSVFPSKEGGWNALVQIGDSGLKGDVSSIRIDAAETLYGADTFLTVRFNPEEEGVVKKGDSGVVRGYEGRFVIETSVPTLPHLTVPDRAGSFLIYRKPSLAPAAKPTQPVNR